MTMRRALAATLSALLLTPALASAAEAAGAPAPAAPHSAAAPSKGAGNPIAAVKGFAKALLAENGKAACGLMTSAYAKKTVAAAVEAGVADPGASCPSVMKLLGKALNASGGIPPYTLKIQKRTKRTATVRLSYKDNGTTGTYSTSLVGGGWVISGSTVSA